MRENRNCQAKRWGIGILVLLCALVMALALPQAASAADAATASVAGTTQTAPSRLAAPVLSKAEVVNRGVMVTWERVSGAARYRVYCKTGSGKWYRAGETTGTSLLVSGANGGRDSFQNGVSYSFTVQCITADRKSPCSGYDQTGLQLTYCNAPVLSKAEAVNGGIRVTWNRVPNADRYRVFCKIGSGKWLPVGDTTGTSLTAAKYDNGKADFKSGRTYSFTVRCVTPDGRLCCSGYDETGLRLTYCERPTLTGTAVFDRGIRVTWEKVPGAARYRVYCRSGGGKWAAVGETDATSLDVRTRDGKNALTSGTKYAFTVRCVTADGKTYTSGYDEAGRETSYVAAPELTGVKNTDSGVTLTWKRSPGAPLYRVYRKTGSGAWTQIGETTAYRYIDTTTQRGTTYRYTVSCVTADGKRGVSGFDHAGLSITAAAIAAPAKTEDRQVSIAVAEASPGNTKAIVSKLENCGVNVTIVGKDADPADFDGLVLPGGGDIDPSRYGMDNLGSTQLSTYYDTVQFTLATRFIRAKKPVLGICRGCQLLNVYFGGTLNQDISGHKKVNLPTTIVAGSRLSSVYGTSLNVYCSHHQSIKRIGTNLNVTMRASDGTIEGIEHAYLPIIGVQWHPEVAGSSGLKLFQYFVRLCQTQ